jgi:hypothetical protein
MISILRALKVHLKDSSTNIMPLRKLKMMLQMIWLECLELDTEAMHPEDLPESSSLDLQVQEEALKLKL